MKRVFSIIFLFLSIYLLPWWLTFIFVCIAFLFFNLFVEGVIIALAIDALYSPNFYFFPNLHFASILAFMLFVFVPIIKKRLLI